MKTVSENSQSDTKKFMKEDAFQNIIWSRVLNIVIHFCHRSTFHGLSQIASARKLRQRLFWIVICISASLGFFIHVHYIIDKYLETPILTNVVQDFHSFIFPDISFCFTNPIYYPPRNTTAHFDLLRHYAEYLDFQRKQHLFITNQVKIAEYLYMTKSDLYGHNIIGTVASCTYMGHNCSHRHFESRHIYPYGLCYTFNSTKLFKKSLRTIDSISNLKNVKPFFQMILYKSVDMESDFNIDPFEDVTMPSGVILMIHEEETFPSVANSFILDSYSQIDLKVTAIKHDSDNIHNKCKHRQDKFVYMDLFENRSSTFYGKMVDCVYETVQSNVIKNCNCVWQHFPHSPVSSTIKFCLDGGLSFAQLRSCLGKTYQEVNDGHLSKCYQDLCRHKIFETVISQSKFPAVNERATHVKWLEILRNIELAEIEHYGRSDLRLKALKNGRESTSMSVGDAFDRGRVDLLDEEFLDRNFAMIRIVPSSYFMDKIEETKSYPLSRLLGDIGGSVGLWVGASLITIFEFLDLIFDFLDIPKEVVKVRSFEKKKRKMMGNNSQRFKFLKGGQRKTVAGGYSNNFLCRESLGEEHANVYRVSNI